MKSKTTSPQKNVKRRQTPEQRARRVQQIFFSALAVIIILSMIISVVSYI